MARAVAAASILNAAAMLLDAAAVEVRLAYKHAPQEHNRYVYKR